MSGTCCKQEFGWNCLGLMDGYVHIEHYDLFCPFMYLFKMMLMVYFLIVAINVKLSSIFEIVAYYETKFLYYSGLLLLSAILILILALLLKATLQPPIRRWYWSSIYFLLFLSVITGIVLLAIYTEYGRLLVGTILGIFIVGLVIAAGISGGIKCIAYITAYRNYRQFEDEENIVVGCHNIDKTYYKVEVLKDKCKKLNLFIRLNQG